MTYRDGAESLGQSKCKVFSCIKKKKVPYWTSKKIPHVKAKTVVLKGAVFIIILLPQ